MHYEELILEIRPGGDGGSEVEARSSCYGRGSAPFRLPFDPGALDRLLAALERRIRSRVSGAVSDAEPGPDPADPDPAGDREPTDELPTDPAALGEALFRALFHDGTADTFNRTFGRVEGRIEGRIEGRLQDGGDDDGTPRGLRLRFLYAPEDPDLSTHGAVPWELLRRPETREFLARRPGTPVVRTIDVPRPVPPLAVDPPLRVLLVEPEPSNLPLLGSPLRDRSDERSRIRRALERAPEEIRLLPPARPELGGLRDRVRDDRVHVLHFVGHGDLTPDGEGILYFENHSGRAEAVPAEIFASQIQQIDSLKLVVLNACSSGALPRHRGRDPYTATAAGLTMLNIPAVVAMQFPVSNRAAVAFSCALYRRLAAHDPVEAAVAEARLAILADQPDSSEWMTPVLYLRGESGRLFAPRSGEAAAGPTPSPTPGGSAAEPDSEPESDSEPNSRPGPLRLGVRSLVGLGEGLEEAADRTLSLVHHFDDRAIRDQALWREAILPELRDFLAPARRARGPVILDLAAHHSIAFLCGALLEAKSGVELSIVQRGHAGTEHWFPARPGETVREPGWVEPATGPADPAAQEAPELRNPDSQDLAVAVSVTHPVGDDVESYLATSGLRVRRVLRASLPEPSGTAVRDGAHALRLAQTLARRIRGRPPEERAGTVHLFAAAPNALLVFLGQLAPLLPLRGSVRIYEFDLELGEEGAYRPGVEWTIADR